MLFVRIAVTNGALNKNNPTSPTTGGVCRNQSIGHGMTPYKEVR